MTYTLSLYVTLSPKCGICFVILKNLFTQTANVNQNLGYRKLQNHHSSLRDILQKIKTSQFMRKVLGNKVKRYPNPMGGHHISKKPISMLSSE